MHRLQVGNEFLVDFQVFLIKFQLPLGVNNSLEVFEFDVLELLERVAEVLCGDEWSQNVVVAMCLNHLIEEE